MVHRSENNTSARRCLLDAGLTAAARESRKGRATEGYNKPTSEQEADRTTTSSGSSSPVVGHACNLGVPEIRSVMEIISRGNRVQVVKLVKHSRNLNILNSAVLIQVRVAAYGSPMDLCQLCRFEGQYFSL